MARLVGALWVGLAAIGVMAGVLPAAGDETAGAKTEEEFKPPPGFKTRKRGELVLYCMTDSTVGTRFKTEKCYDEAQMRDYIAAQQENKRDIDRVRNTCSTGAGEYCRRQ